MNRSQGAPRCKKMCPLGCLYGKNHELMLTRSACVHPCQLLASCLLAKLMLGYHYITLWLILQLSSTTYHSSASLFLFFFLFSGFPTGRAVHYPPDVLSSEHFIRHFHSLALKMSFSVLTQNSRPQAAACLACPVAMSLVKFILRSVMSLVVLFVFI